MKQSLGETAHCTFLFCSAILAVMLQPQPTAADLCRGIARMFWRMGAVVAREAPLGNGQRADVLALGPDGRLTLIEIKVSVADLKADSKWRRYLEYCDRFYWAAPPGFPLDLFTQDNFGAGRAGLIVADAFDASIITPAAEVSLAPARRRAELIRFAMRAGAQLMAALDPELDRAAAA